METFALVAFLVVNGEAESFILDRDLSRRDCATVAEFVTAELILADPGSPTIFRPAESIGDGVDVLAVCMPMRV